MDTRRFSQPTVALRVRSAPDHDGDWRYSDAVTGDPQEPEEAVAALAAALVAVDPEASAGEVVARFPTFLDGWARLGQLACARGDAVAAYAFARTGYHRGLDRLRKHGWGGTGLVRWAQPGNRGFLRSLQLLLVAAAALGELDESARCRSFLIDLDPDDGLGVAGYPEVPGPDWRRPPFP